VKTAVVNKTVTGRKGAVNNAKPNAKLEALFLEWSGAVDNAREKFALLCSAAKKAGKRAWGEFRDAETIVYVNARLKAAKHGVTLADLTGDSDYAKEMRANHKQAYELSRTAKAAIGMKFYRVESEVWPDNSKPEKLRLPAGSKPKLDTVEGSIAKLLAPFEGKELKALKMAIIAYVNSL
jgi:hypothetical protein